MKKIHLCVVCAVAVLGLPASASSVKKSVPPEHAKTSPVLDLQRWLQQRWQSMGNPFRTDDRERIHPPRFDNNDTTCDPSRTKCPIG